MTIVRQYNHYRHGRHLLGCPLISVSVPPNLDMYKTRMTCLPYCGSLGSSEKSHGEVLIVIMELCRAVLYDAIFVCLIVCGTVICLIVGIHSGYFKAVCSISININHASSAIGNVCRISYSSLSIVMFSSLSNDLPQLCLSYSATHPNSLPHSLSFRCRSLLSLHIAGIACQCRARPHGGVSLPSELSASCNAFVTSCNTERPDNKSKGGCRPDEMNELILISGSFVLQLLAFVILTDIQLFSHYCHLLLSCHQMCYL